MSGRSDMMMNGTTSVSTRYYAGETLTQRISNTPLRKTPSIPSSIGGSKSNSFFSQNNTSQDPNLSGSQYSNSNQHNSSQNYSQKNSLKTLTIDTNDEGSTYNLLNSNHLNSYSATNNSSGFYAFTRSSLMSSLNGNLTTKYSKGQDNIKATNFLSPSKSITSTKALVSSTNFPYTSTSSQTNLNSGLTSPLMSTLSPTSYHFKTYSTKSISFEPTKVQNQSTTPTASQSHTKNLNVTQSTSTVNLSMNNGSNSQSQLKIAPKTPSNNELNTSTNNPNNVSNISLNSKAPSQPTILQKKQLTPIPNHEPTKCSVKRNGIVKAYAANTNQGIVRNYNEDRVSIILNIMKPASRANEEWPKCSFFGVYDGHGGVNCADFLRDNLHQYVNLIELALI